MPNDDSEQIVNDNNKELLNGKQKNKRITLIILKFVIYYIDVYTVQ